ncbi:MAG: GPR endopeptidase [Lachnospiraceae bacterium]|nr:GPR endopeptidase [Lachnospiraceae bacterium]
MQIQQIRTDLALEAHETVEESSTHIHGIEVHEKKFEEDQVYITNVSITTKNAAKALGKPMGTYITLEAPALDVPDEGSHREVSTHLSEILKDLIPEFEKEKSILVIGLGNREVTADSLGPHVIDNLCITRHIIMEYGTAAYDKNRMHSISSLAPGVMAQNGMETAEIIKGVIDQTSPDMVIVIDSLAARTLHRLNRTIQITDTGIHPGSGVGNHRNALTEESLGVPVIAIGIPTVVDAATIVWDALEDFSEKSNHSIDLHVLQDECSNTMLQELNNMYVTGKDVDAVIKRLSYTISEALNMTFDEIRQ